MVTERHMLTSWTTTAVDWLRVLLEERYGMPFKLTQVGNEWCLSLAGNDGVIHIAADPGMFTRARSDLPFSNWSAEKEGWVSVLGGPLPTPGVGKLPSSLIDSTKNGFVIHYDILGLTYWMLTRQEEVERADLDQHGRFPATASHAFKHGYLQRPVVDEWLDILRQVIQRIWPNASLKQHQFSMKVSHDVDAASRYGFRPWRKVPFSMAADILKYRDARGIFAPWIRFRTRDRLHPLDAFNTFDWLMDVSDKYGLTSAFNFICNRRGTRYDSDYDLEHPAIRDLIRRIHMRGHEIGLHPSYNTFLEPDQISLEADRLRRICAEEGVKQNGFGGRMHWLQWRQPTTLLAWNDAGLDYDSSMGYPECPGFRCGTCFDYPAFDPVGQKQLAIKVRPLIVMEGSILSSYGLNLDAGQAAHERILELKHICRLFGGAFTLLWHNSCLVIPAWRKLYMAALND